MENNDAENNNKKIRDIGKQIKNLNLSDVDKEADIETYIKEANDIKEFSGMNSFRIKRLYPKAYKAFFNYLVLSGNGLEFSDDIMAGVLLYSPRTLYEFFDKNEVFINITGDNNAWLNNFDFKTYKSRIDCELFTFEKGFATLNGKI